ncbi:hypothetical protein U9M48_018829 [Paspalum notatum var. saurae]|uniref:Uncharacterized protein n=1 Tax=Paspalum notatum var. saurae TaxID=547442 RepID=A0AAQ3WQ61_PASNO
MDSACDNSGWWAAWPIDQEEGGQQRWSDGATTQLPLRLHPCWIPPLLPCTSSWSLESIIAAVGRRVATLPANVAKREAVGEHYRKSSCVSEASPDDLGLASATAESGAGTTLGCSCKQCADTSFKFRDNK